MIAFRQAAPGDEDVILCVMASAFNRVEGSAKYARDERRTRSDLDDHFVLEKDGPSQLGGSGSTFAATDLEGFDPVNAVACAAGYSCTTLAFTGGTSWAWGNPESPLSVVALDQPDGAAAAVVRALCQDPKCRFSERGR